MSTTEIEQLEARMVAAGRRLARAEAKGKLSEIIAVRRTLVKLFTQRLEARVAA